MNMVIRLFSFRSRVLFIWVLKSVPLPGPLPLKPVLSLFLIFRPNGFRSTEIQDVCRTVEKLQRNYLGLRSVYRGLQKRSIFILHQNLTVAVTLVVKRDSRTDFSFSR